MADLFNCTYSLLNWKFTYGIILSFTFLYTNSWMGHHPLQASWNNQSTVED